MTHRTTTPWGMRFGGVALVMTVLPGCGEPSTPPPPEPPATPPQPAPGGKLPPPAGTEQAPAPGLPDVASFGRSLFASTEGGGSVGVLQDGKTSREIPGFVELRGLTISGDRNDPGLLCRTLSNANQVVHRRTGPDVSSRDRRTLTSPWIPAPLTPWGERMHRFSRYPHRSPVDRDPRGAIR